MKRFLYSLFSRAFFRGLAWGLNNRHEDFYNHVNEHEGVIHIVYRELTFSVCQRGVTVMMLDQFGDQLPPLRWAEQRLIADAIATNIKSFMTVSRVNVVVVTATDLTVDDMVPA